MIPVEAQKPIDKRYSKIKADDTNALQGELYHTDENGINKQYHTHEIYDNLGLTRETLRYYEEIGLIKPKRNQHNHYREFNLYDISRLMSIDFFKKRGFTPTEIKEFQKTLPEEYTGIMQNKIDLLRKDIEDLNITLKRLEETNKFYTYTLDHCLQFTIKDLPSYYVHEFIGSVASFHEYQDKVLNYLNVEKEDILSNMVRAITFDENGYLTTGMYIVKPVKGKKQIKGKPFLESGKCLHTTLIADNNDASVMEKMFDLCHEWAKQYNLSFRGVGYIFICFVIFHEQTDKHCYDVWVLLK